MSDVNPNQERNSGSENSLGAPLIAKMLEGTQIGKYHTKGGHGFAAEDANNLADVFRGSRAKVVGTSNQVNGADRVVDGLLVQSKYCQTAAESISAAFDSASGQYRYVGQKLEVPRDQYASCVELMREKIAQGKVPGFTSPADAESIVHQGTVTYRQARNIALAGTLDSLIFDAKSQAVTSAYVFAISFAVVYAHNRWRGELHQGASRAAIANAVVTGSATLITGVLTSQLLRTRATAIGAVAVRSGVQSASESVLGQALINQIAAGSLGKVVSSAAAVNHVSKLLRTNVISAIVMTTVTCTPDFYRAVFERSISWQQFTKNISLNLVSIASGTAGFMGGAAAGAVIGSAVPGVGTAFGGIVGGIIGTIGVSLGASVAAKAIADRILDDDSVRLSAILQDEIATLACEFMLTEEEAAKIFITINETATAGWFRRMFKITKQGQDELVLRKFVRTEFEPRFEELVQRRTKLHPPTPNELDVQLSLFLDELTVTEAKGMVHGAAGPPPQSIVN